MIRDLLTRAQEVHDLMDRLGGIPPQTLSQRLRELEDAGIVTADREPGRREVWYRLTPAGADLGRPERARPPRSPTESAGRRARGHHATSAAEAPGAHRRPGCGRSLVRRPAPRGTT